MNKENTLKIDKGKRFLVETNDVFDLAFRQLRIALILLIKVNMNNNMFSFQNIAFEGILNEINNLDNSNSTQ